MWQGDTQVSDYRKRVRHTVKQTSETAFLLDFIMIDLQKKTFILNTLAYRRYYIANDRNIIY